MRKRSPKNVKWHAGGQISGDWAIIRRQSSYGEMVMIYHQMNFKNTENGKCISRLYA